MSASNLLSACNTLALLLLTYADCKSLTRGSVLKNVILLPIAIAAMVLCSQAWAQDYGRVSAAFTADHQNMIWQFDPVSGRYNLTSVLTLVTGQLSGSGAFVSLTKPINETRTDTIGKEIKGEMSLELVPETTNPYLNLKLEVNDMNNGFPITSATSYTLPVELINGSTWQDYKDGKTIQLRTTTEASQNHSQKMTEFLESLLLKAFPNGFAGMPTTGKVESAKLVEDLIITINKSELVIDNMTTDYKMNLTLSY